MADTQRSTKDRFELSLYFSVFLNLTGKLALFMTPFILLYDGINGITSIFGLVIEMRFGFSFIDTPL